MHSQESFSQLLSNHTNTCNYDKYCIFISLVRYDVIFITTGVRELCLIQNLSENRQDIVSKYEYF